MRLACAAPGDHPSGTLLVRGVAGASPGVTRVPPLEADSVRQKGPRETQTADGGECDGLAARQAKSALAGQKVVQRRRTPDADTAARRGKSVRGGTTEACGTAENVPNEKIVEECLIRISESRTIGPRSHAEGTRLQETFRNDKLQNQHSNKLSTEGFAGCGRSRMTTKRMAHATEMTQANTGHTPGKRRWRAR
jgi:hypothetical protein